MSVKVTLGQVQSDLPELLDQLAKTGEVFVVQRGGKDCAVIVSARQWRRRRIAQDLDELGTAPRLAKAHQKRAEQLLAAKANRSLTAAERRELKNLLRKSAEVLSQRVRALDDIL
jgi:antitoxin (DNA-binding transcriptional repressor) of toxin-antitoxin stability system